ncbi:hypothetical protein CXG81DRAFT_27483 [Caulochytrium protostelioides]|nr:hypothetical protein CXG81DRAFT_27483 [Caulochytrium protostelioides]|eukprot:RKO99784.1 hypothetical protein CXG81DRAFT_27483 [Caulochytrium protostelioides]
MRSCDPVAARRSAKGILYLSALACLISQSAAADVGPTLTAALETGNSDWSAYNVARNFTGVRGMTLDPGSGDLLALSRSSQQVIAIWEDASDPTGFTNATILDVASLPGSPVLALTHGLTYYQANLLVSSATDVYQFPYPSGSRKAITNPPRTVVSNIAGGGRGGAPLGHQTRSIEISPDGQWLYVQIGSLNNVDEDSSRSQIRRVPWAEALAAINADTGSIDFSDMEVFADGLRNAVAFAHDQKGQLWAADNGADEIERPDIGLDHQENPVEEINLLASSGQFYGYPFCFSSNETSTDGTVVQRAMPATKDDGVHSDAWCQDPNNNTGPLATLPAHSSPIAMAFMPSHAGCAADADPNSAPLSFPCSWVGDLFVTTHGSWNADVARGYALYRVPFGSDGRPLSQAPDILLQATEAAATCSPSAGGGLGCFRPSGLVVKNGTFFVASDATGDIVYLVNSAGSKSAASSLASPRISSPQAVLATIAFLFVAMM